MLSILFDVISPVFVSHSLSPQTKT